MDRDQTLPASDDVPEPQYQLPQRPRRYVGQRIGPYEVVGEIAKGGQGVVLRARQAGADREVALKLLLRPTHKARLRFRQEGQVLARIQHPNVVRVIDLGEASGTHYLAMELLDARPLDADLQTKGPPPRDWLVRVLSQVADALQHCHDMGLVHRDLKPDNILLEQGSGRPVLVDFGLVKRDPARFGELSMDEYARLSKTGELSGTPAWMAPEQIMSQGAVGPATDVHALGMILFTLLTGSRPYDEENSFALLRAITTQDPPDPRKLSPSVSADLAALCKRAMAKNPTDRPSAAEFGAALRGHALTPRRRLSTVVAALVIAGGIAGAIAAGLHASSAPTADPGDAGPRETTTEKPPALTMAKLRAGEREWAKLELSRGSARSRHDALVAWLSRYEGHPDTPKVRAARREARLRFPLGRLISGCTNLVFVGDRLVTVQSKTGTVIRVWELSEERISEVATWSTAARVARVAGLPTGELVLAWNTGRSSPGVLEVRELLTGTVLRRLTHPSGIGQTLASPDGTFLAIAGVDAAGLGVVRLLDSLSGEVRAVCGPFEHQVNSLAISHSGERLAVCYGREMTLETNLFARSPS